MMIMSGTVRAIAVGCTLALSSPAAARPPASTSMADCAGYLDAAAARDPGVAPDLRALSDGWARIGVEQARAEGQFYPDFYVASLRERSRQHWMSVPPDALAAPQVADWSRGCLKLATSAAVGDAG